MAPLRAFLVSIVLVCTGCRFDEPPPSRTVYFDSVAKVAKRPLDHITRFQRPRIR